MGSSWGHLVSLCDGRDRSGFGGLSLLHGLILNSKKEGTAVNNDSGGMIGGLVDMWERNQQIYHTQTHDRIC